MIISIALLLPQKRSHHSHNTNTPHYPNPHPKFLKRLSKQSDQKLKEA